MAKNLVYKKQVVDSISAKGCLNEKATTISFVEDKIERTVKLQDLLDKFASTPVSISIKAVSEEELDIEDEEEIDAGDLAPDEE